MTTTKQTCDCYKCGGSGHIAAFRGIANGVCFTCGGTGKVAFRVRKEAVKPLSDCMKQIIETITTGDLSGLSYGKLNELRNAAHWPCPHCPNLLAIWCERGDAFFFAAQKEKLAAMSY